VVVELQVITAVQVQEKLVVEMVEEIIQALLVGVMALQTEDQVVEAEQVRLGLVEMVDLV
tara:strand:+ start:551 stop:730 length:180 start_codon:yes stop_codon:yes gene_type:complete